MSYISTNSHATAGWRGLGHPCFASGLLQSGGQGFRFPHSFRLPTYGLEPSLNVSGTFHTYSILPPVKAQYSRPGINQPGLCLAGEHAEMHLVPPAPLTMIRFRILGVGQKAVMPYWIFLPADSLPDSPTIAVIPSPNQA